MQRLFLLTTGLFLLLILTVACGGDSSENAFPKKLPVDERSQKEQALALANSAIVVKEWDSARQSIEGLLESSSGYYQTKDGKDDFTAEYTTYYLEEEKTTPIKTIYTYKTGNFDIIYWLPEGQIWLERDGYSFLVEGDDIRKTMRDGEEMEATSVEQEEAIQLLARAREDISPLPYTL